MNSNLRPPLKYPNSTSTKIYVLATNYIDQYLEKTQKIRNGENQLLLSTISPCMAVSTHPRLCLPKQYLNG